MVAAVILRIKRKLAGVKLRKPAIHKRFLFLLFLPVSYLKPHRFNAMGLL